jgi:carboxymethylenebutenolidase
MPDEKNELSRRDFVALSVAAGLAAATENLAAAAELPVSANNVNVITPDGTCDAVFIHPNTGSYPGVIIWADAFGLRPTLVDMGKRLAGEGYAVLVPNPYYRLTKAPGIEAAGFDFSNQAAAWADRW